MHAMRVHHAGQPLRADELSLPTPAPHEVLLAVQACGVCRTDLHIADGELNEAVLPLVPGHEIVGRVVARGALAERYALGERVGVPWLAGTCGHCVYCRNGQENLCDAACFTGYHRDGGYAEYVVADERYCVAIPARYDDAAAAPLLCAGLIGYRAYRMAGTGARLGLYGFGAAAHILVQLACAEGRAVYAFTRPGDIAGQDFARSLGACWAGDSTAMPPHTLDAAILFAPVGALVPQALRVVRKGGRVICGGIHMSDIPQFPYALLWGERSVQSVANLTRADAEDFMRVAARIPFHTAVTTYPLREANTALADLRAGHIEGAAVLVPATAGAAQS